MDRLNVVIKSKDFEVGATLAVISFVLCNEKLLISLQAFIQQTHSDKGSILDVSLHTTAYNNNHRKDFNHPSPRAVNIFISLLHDSL